MGGGLYKQDIIEYLDTLQMAAPMGLLWRGYLRAGGLYKDVIGVVAPALSKSQKKLLEKAMPAFVFGLPVLGLLFSMCCVRCCCGPEPARRQKGPKKGGKKESNESKEPDEPKGS